MSSGGETIPATEEDPLDFLIRDITPDGLPVVDPDLMVDIINSTEQDLHDSCVNKYMSTQSVSCLIAEANINIMKSKIEEHMSNSGLASVSPSSSGSLVSFTSYNYLTLVVPEQRLIDCIIFNLGRSTEPRLLSNGIVRQLYNYMIQQDAVTSRRIGYMEAFAIIRECGYEEVVEALESSTDSSQDILTESINAITEAVIDLAESETSDRVGRDIRVDIKKVDRNSLAVSRHYAGRHRRR